MSRSVRVGFCIVLFALSACGGLRRESSWGDGGGGPGGPSLSTIHARVFALIAGGNIQQAIEYYKLEVGVEEAPRWLLVMNSSFSIANRAIGPCREVADGIYEAFKQLGQHPQLVRIAATDGKFLSWQSRIMMSNNNYHVAVMNLGRIYDAFTGPEGMLWVEYEQMVHHGGILQYTSLP